LAALLVAFYPLTEERVRAIQLEMEERLAATEAEESV
jgi:Na+/melibiose symporter-like transporter